MSNFQAGYAFVALSSLVLGIVLFFIDEMLLYAIGFFVLFVMMALIKITWGISGWVDNVTRKLGDDQ
jgi:hypothetical protein